MAQADEKQRNEYLKRLDAVAMTAAKELYSGYSRKEIQRAAERLATNGLARAATRGYKGCTDRKSAACTPAAIMAAISEVKALQQSIESSRAGGKAPEPAKGAVKYGTNEAGYYGADPSTAGNFSAVVENTDDGDPRKTQILQLRQQREKLVRSGMASRARGGAQAVRKQVEALDRQMSELLHDLTKNPNYKEGASDPLAGQKAKATSIQKAREIASRPKEPAPSQEPAPAQPKAAPSAPAAAPSSSSVTQSNVVALFKSKYPRYWKAMLAQCKAAGTDPEAVLADAIRVARGVNNGDTSKRDGRDALRVLQDKYGMTDISGSGRTDYGLLRALRWCASHAKTGSKPLPNDEVKKGGTSGTGSGTGGSSGSTGTNTGQDAPIVGSAVYKIDGRYYYSQPGGLYRDAEGNRYKRTSDGKMELVALSAGGDSTSQGASAAAQEATDERTAEHDATIASGTYGMGGGLPARKDAAVSAQNEGTGSDDGEWVSPEKKGTGSDEWVSPEKKGPKDGAVRVRNGVRYVYDAVQDRWVPGA